MLRLDLFKQRNFAAGNLETFLMYGGLGLTQRGCELSSVRGRQYEKAMQSSSSR